MRQLVIGLAAISLAACQQDDSVVDLGEELPKADDLNILVISFDAFRADNLAAYGNTMNLTPNLDAFAEESVIFTNAYVAGQATPSSFAAAFTGAWPFKVFREWKLVDTQTLAEVFKAGGYLTAAFLNNKQLVSDRRFNQGFDIYEVTRDFHDDPPMEGITGFLSEHADQQFFAWVHFVNPHSPYLYREVAEHLYTPGYEGEYEEGSPARIQALKIDRVPEKDLNRIKELYYGEVYYMDDRFGSLIGHLRDLDLLDRTVIVITADHGEALVEHGVIGHHQLYEEVIRVPMLVRHPRGAQGHRVEARVSNIDLLPSLASIAGLTYVEEIVDGVDWTAGFERDRPLVSTQMTNKGKISMTLLHGDHKFISWCTKKERFREELFNLAADPLELTSLSESEDADIAAVGGEMYEKLVMIAGNDPCVAIDEAVAGADITSDLDQETLDTLKSLGYIQ